MSNRARRALWLVLLSLLPALPAGCGGGDSTGPAEDLTGDWTYAATDLAGSGVSCSVASLILTLRQSGGTFAGSGNGGTLSCQSAADTASTTLDGVSVVNGRVSGQAVWFDFGSSDLHQSGSISGATITGAATWRLDLGSPTGVIVLSGPFSAARQ